MKKQKTVRLYLMAVLTGALMVGVVSAQPSQAAFESGSLSGESTAVQKGRGDLTPSVDESNVNDYTFQDEQLNLDANTGNVRVLRTDQKALLNDFVTATFPVSKADTRELRNVLKTIIGLEGGRAEVIKDKEAGQQFIQVICPKFMLPYLEKAVPALDEEWVREFDTGAGDTYYKAKNRGAAEIDFIASNYASDSGFSVVDSTNNAISRIDEPYRIENYTKGAEIVDIPANQVLLEVKIVEINSNNDLKLGTDYIAWKNGPGRNLAHFVYQGADAQSSNENFTSIFDPFIEGGDAAGFLKDASLHTDYDQYYRAVNYLLTSNYVDFLQVKGEARVLTEESLMVKSANTASLSAEDVIVAIVSEPGDLDSIDADTKQGVASDIDGYRNDYNGNVYSVPVRDSDRSVHLRPSGSVGVFLQLTPFVALESMELVVDLCNAEMNGMSPNGQPIINERALTTTVRLMDGEPCVIGGLKRTTDIKETAKAPGLGDIPVLGYLFGGETDAKRQNDVLVVITPRFYLSSQPSITAPASVKNIADVVVGGKDVALPAGTIGYDQWLLDN